ncbi:MAG: serine--tRNA ligase [Candidatus Nomurabacteria bacterium]|jgi:seryl-tRNA synthetase|nr:serine--tRNA ligase [Candidatus Nomurabacteria bacterium]
MLDMKFIAEHRAEVERSAELRGYKIDLDKLLKVDSQRRKLQSRVDALREKRNALTAQMKNSKPTPDLIEQGKKLKSELSDLETQLKNLTDDWTAQLKSVPNLLAPDVPPGGENDGVEVRRWGNCKKSARDHLDFALAKDWVDFERGAKVAGAKFYFLKGDLALLENAALQFAIQTILKNGFTLMDVPNLVKENIAAGSGFAPRTSDQSDSYYVEGEDLTLIATAEMPLTGYHANEILDETDLPKFYAGYSPCYRKEAGTYGKHARGLFRVHQFNKLEMYAYCLPEDSAKIHQKILGVEEAIWQAIGIPYRVVNIAAGDLGAPAYQKFDIEYWSPADQTYRELTSCSNCTDFQARNLNIRVRRTGGRIETLHTLNGTAASLARTLVAIVENFQDDSGDLIVPEVLRPFMFGRTKI